ncbi:MAG: hypothetical protein J07HQW2_00582 [Haloquadratum walsbyi J07HQW2]|uniref:Uncharacterized protein n=1 Tax=Haloquadratum walsbyi J07HQW2 TaxID=1238425 RepID=U1NBU5_9EURY|nr:MAG: hypothetical protein J07HQW2_00582 [Haloquadratum walsbyi J07HQW2]
MPVPILDSPVVLQSPHSQTILYKPETSIGVTPATCSDDANGGPGETTSAADDYVGQLNFDYDQKRPTDKYKLFSVEL